METSIIKEEVKVYNMKLNDDTSKYRHTFMNAHRLRKRRLYKSWTVLKEFR
jgi:hypothetical protein